MKPIFVARQCEFFQLNQLLQLVLAGQGQVAFVLGEAGQGKTALLQAFARQSQHIHSNLRMAGGNCNDYTGMGDPYLPFREILAGLTESDGNQSVDDRTSHLLPRAVQTLM